MRKFSQGNYLNKPTKTSKGVTKPRFYEHCIPKTVFQRLVKEITLDQRPGFRIGLEALSALQTAAEDYLVGYLEDVGMCAEHAKRKTIMAVDMELVEKIKNKDQ